MFLVGAAWFAFLAEAAVVAVPPPPLRREIAEIRIHLANVFDPDDPKENAWPFRAVNAIHIVTKEDFLRRAIPLQSGDLVSPEEIEEAERILRRFSFLRLVDIEPIEREGLRSCAWRQSKSCSRVITPSRVAICPRSRSPWGADILGRDSNRLNRSAPATRRSRPG